MSEKKPILELIITPMEIEVEDCEVTVLEVTKLPLPWEEYQASIQIKTDNVTSKIFQVTFKDKDELKRKLVMETTKFKYALILYGEKELRNRGII